MIPSSDCADLVKSFESLRLSAYRDPDGIWTIGWGHTGSVHEGDTVTQQEAERLLSSDLAEAAAVVNEIPALSQCQFDALVSFCFNVGPGAPGVKDGLVWLRSGAHSTLYRLLMTGKWDAAAAEFPKWCHTGGAISLGLVRRRKAEQQLFLRTELPSAA